MTHLKLRSLAVLALPLALTLLAAGPAKAACTKMTLADLNTQIESTSLLLTMGENSTPAEQAAVRALRQEYWNAVEVHNQAAKTGDPEKIREACAMYEAIQRKLQEIKAEN